MTNLFIIGNGFDISHGMKTKYSDFRNYLIKKYSIKQADLESSYGLISESITFPDGDEKYNLKDVAITIINILDSTEGGTWNNIETSLGKLDYSEYFDNDNDDNIFNDDSDSYDRFFKINYYNNEDNASKLRAVLEQTPDLFQNWVKTIRISKKLLIDFQKLIYNDNNFFLNFNYTMTLEKLYKQKNVCHIHGTKNSEIFFGHGNIEDKTDKMQKEFFGAEDELNRLHFYLLKNTKQAYQNNKSFFDNLEKLSNNDKIKIYSYGFSFSPVDEFYLKKIFKRINTTNIYFYINDFDNKERRESFEKTIYSCGFKGKISSYHIDINVK